MGRESIQLSIHINKLRLKIWLLRGCSPERFGVSLVLGLDFGGRKMEEIGMKVRES